MTSLEIGLQTTMGAILQAYPSAKVGLFQQYHIGGCASCGYQPTDTLAGVCQTHNITDPLEEVVACIRQSAEVEAQLHIHPTEVAAALEQRESIRLLDVRTPEEWHTAHLPGAELLTVELTFEALDAWSKDTPIVVYSNLGQRSLNKASYFRAYGLTNVKSMDGGLEAWPAAVRALEDPLRTQDRIASILRHDLSALTVAVEDESALHAGHTGAASGGGHYRVTVVSPLFEGKSPVERHRMVYAALAQDMQQAIHALALTTLAPSQQQVS
jgi:stress-induced morphogen/rhodanese-related sulfurtransferase